MEVIFKNVQNKKFDDVEKILVKLFNFIRDDYYKSTLNNYQGFRDYNDQLKSIKDNFRYVLYNIERYQNGKSLDQVYPSYPKNYKSNLFKLNTDKSKSSSSGVSSYVSSVSGYDANLKYVKTNVKVLRKYMKNLHTVVKEATVKKNISSITTTNALDKKFVSLYKRICKSLEKNKDEKVMAILMKMKKLNIIQSINDFNKYVETEKLKHIRDFKASLLSAFFTMKLTKTKTLPFL
jgi:hypothetical protein